MKASERCLCSTLYSQRSQQLLVVSMSASPKDQLAVQRIAACI